MVLTGFSSMRGREVSMNATLAIWCMDSAILSQSEERRS